MSYCGDRRLMGKGEIKRKKARDVDMCVMITISDVHLKP